MAVTGGVACGKSRVGALLAEWGMPVCEADDLAHDLMRPGGGVFDEVVRVFGRGVLGSDGQVDRAALGRVVFAQPEALRTLNAVVHPEVKKSWEAWLTKQEREFSRAAAVIIPLLYEAGFRGGWDAVICVTATERTQRNRLACRGLTEAEARRRMSAQMSTARKAELADYVIVNDGAEDLLREQTRRVWRHILET